MDRINRKELKSKNRYIGEGLVDMVVDAWPKMFTRLTIMRDSYLVGWDVHPSAREFEQINKSHSYGRQVYHYVWACSIDGIKPNKTQIARDLNTSRSNVNNIIEAFQDIGLLDADASPTSGHYATARERVIAALNEPAFKAFVLAANAYYAMRRVDNLEDIIEDTDPENVYWRDGVPTKIDNDAAMRIYEEWVGTTFNPANADGHDDEEKIVQFKDSTPS